MKTCKLKWAAVVALSVIAFGCTPSNQQQPPLHEKSNSAIFDRPNILMIVFEDMSPRIGAYGDEIAHTPTLDRLADESIVYENVFTTAGVCAPSRAALITGRYQQSIGGQHMRTYNAYGAPGPAGNYYAVPPEDIKAFPELLREAGYYTLNINIDGERGKTDYQFGEPFTIWDDDSPPHAWRERDISKPFFSMVTVMQTHESYLWPIDPPAKNPAGGYFASRNRAQLAGQVLYVSPDDVEVPAYLPDTPAVRRDIAQQYNNVSHAELMVADLLDQLEKDGLADDTIVIVTADHGDGLPRMKRSVYDSGIHVPLMIRLPSGERAGTRRDELISFVDFAPTILSWAGAEIPEHLNGRVFIGEVDSPERDYVYAAMDRHDELPDRIRAVRDQRYKYLYNYSAEHAFFRPLAFRDALPSMQSVWQEYEAGSLSREQAQYFSEMRSAEELYDTENDPDEVYNLVGDPAYKNVLERMRSAYQLFESQAEDWSVNSEAVMVAEMWPEGVQPVTEPPVFEIIEGQLQLSSETEGASIGYRIQGRSQWQLYGKPIGFSNETIEAKAIRYGYQESDISVFIPESSRRNTSLIGNI